MTKELPTRLGMAMNSLYLICVIAFAIAILHNHLQIIFHKLPLDYNETGMLVTTATIADGQNPYSLESQPIRTSLYPVLYNIVVAPFSVIFGNTLELHRLIAGLFILGFCGICFYLCRKEAGTRTDSFTAAALVYAGLLYYSTPIASVNGLGLCLFLAAIALPWIDGFSTRSLAASIVLGVLAFHTKQYFIACVGYVALYLFLAESKKRAIYYGLATAAAFFAVLAVVCYTSPYYLEATVFAIEYSAQLAASDEHLVSQLREFTQIYLPLLVILAVAIVYRWRSTTRGGEQIGEKLPEKKFLNILDFNEPLLQRKPDYIWFCCACSLVIILFVLGKNRGNQLTYLFQFISPFLLVGIFALVSGTPRWRWPFRILILLALYNSYAMLPKDFTVREKNWNIVKAEIAKSTDIYASTLVLAEVLKKDAPFYQNPSTRYFIFGDYKPAFLLHAEHKDTVAEIWERYVRFIQSKIRKREFDLMLIDMWMPFPNSPNVPVDTETLLHANYKMTAKMTLPLVQRLGGGNFRLQVWKPLTKNSKDEPKNPDAHL